MYHVYVFEAMLSAGHQTCTMYMNIVCCRDFGACNEFQKDLHVHTQPRYDDPSNGKAIKYIPCTLTSCS